MSKQKHIHTIIVIGWITNKRCYLDVGMEEACKRFRAEFEVDLTDKEWKTFEKSNIKEIKFEDEFCAYDVWE